MYAWINHHFQLMYLMMQILPILAQTPRIYTLGKKGCYPLYEAIILTWIEFLCFHRAAIDMKCTCYCSNEIGPYLGRAFTSVPSGIVEIKTRSLGGHCPKFASALWQVRLEWAQRWKNLAMAHWQHVTLGDESTFRLNLVDSRLSVCRLPYWVQAHGGPVHIWGAFHSGAKLPLVLQEIHRLWGLHTGAFCETSCVRVIFQAVFRG